MRHYIFLALLASSSLQALPESVTINDGWLFGPEHGATVTTVNIPHTWNTDAYTVKYYSKGKYKYQRSLSLSPEDAARKHYLRLEGVSKAADVYVNGKKAASHAGGYTEFIVPLNQYLSFSAPNDITIIVDNDRNDIPPISGDFTFFGGIYRDVWLEDYAPLHFAVGPLATEGLIVTPTLTDGSGNIAVDASFVNESDKAENISLKFNLYNPQGQLIDSSVKKIRVKAGEEISTNHTFSKIQNPSLWSPSDPALYRVETILTDKSGAELDRRVADTGLREFHFDADGRFVLNGTPLKLRGICRHQDQMPYGPALSDETHRRDMQIAKDLGANFIRISHYPQDPAILEMADRLGLLAWEEIPVIDFLPNDKNYEANAETNLREMISAHRNHPSIVMWGYMNEILLKVPGDNTPEGSETVGRTKLLAARLDSLCRAIDPSRLTTMAYHGSDRYRTTGLSGITDVDGWNLYQGWYGGDLSGFERFLSKERHESPDKPIIVSEYGAGSDRRLHSLSPEPFDFSIEYQQKYLEHYLPVLEDSVFVAGSSIWNLIDFCSANREESMPRINNKGLLYPDHTPKDVYHLYKAAWRDDIDHVYIASRDWASRTAVTDANTAVMPVKVYANTPAVRLTVNGKSYGDSTVTHNTVVYNVPLAQGRNVLEAKGGNTSDVFVINLATVPSTLTEASFADKELAVNAGSGCSYTSPVSSLTWVADREYTPGGWGRIGGKNKNVTSEIKGTADGPLFQSMIENPEGYRFDLPDGDYELELGFADPYGNSEKLAYFLERNDDLSAENATFSIAVNGATVEQDFSPASTVGNKFACVKKYRVHAKDGKVEVSFSPVKGNVILNSIKIRKV